MTPSASSGQGALLYSVAMMAFSFSSPKSVIQRQAPGLLPNSEQRTVSHIFAGAWHCGQNAIHTPPVRLPRRNSTVS